MLERWAGAMEKLSEVALVGGTMAAVNALRLYSRALDEQPKLPVIANKRAKLTLNARMMFNPGSGGLY